MFAKFFNSLGKLALNFFAELGQFSKLFGQILKYTPQLLKKRKLLLYQMEHIGVNSLPLVIIIAIFTGAVAAWQAAYQLKGVAPMSFLGTATSRAIITELGPVLTAIVIAGRVGASIAAELGSMKVTEQIDALRAMATSPIKYLVVPRFLACAIMMPILVIFADVAGIIGGLFMSIYLGVPGIFFIAQAEKFLFPGDILAGIIKGMAFGIIIALVGCYKGLYASGGAEGVGQSTSSSAVNSYILIILADFFLNWVIYAILGIA